MASVFVTRRLVGDALERLSAAHDVEVWEGALPPSAEELRSRASAVDGLLCLLTDRVDAALLEACPRLRVVANYAVGTDNVDLSACLSRGVAVGRTPDVLTDATADLTWALILAVARRLFEAASAVGAGEWRTWEATGWLGMGLAGRRLLVVGPGRIGRAVGARGAAFGMDVAYVGRGEDLVGALGGADVVSVHAPLNDASRGMFGEGAFAAMKRGAVFVNTARGALVDQSALLRVLVSGHLGGAGLDVTDPEPLGVGDPLLGAPRLVVLPHVGSATVEARSAMTRLCVENLEAGLAGKPLPHPAA
jgi:glyoxylate reductase